MDYLWNLQNEQRLCLEDPILPPRPVSVLQLLSCYFIEESPRWLIDNGRGEKAKQIIIKYHTSGDAEDYMVLLELGEIGEALRIEKEALVNTSYLSFCKTKGNRLRFFIILAVGFLSQWSGNGLISYYLTLILNSVGSTSQDTQTLINGLLTIWGLVTTFFSSLVNKFGRGRCFWYRQPACWCASSVRSYFLTNATFANHDSLDGAQVDL